MTVLDLFSLDGRTAVVTGGTGLFGKHFAAALAEAGAHVVITSRSADDALHGAQALRDRGLKASGAVLDLGAPESIDAFIERIAAEHERIDVLVNNAVHRQGGDLAGTTAHDWDQTSRINSRGMFLICQRLSPMMIDAGSGSIINIGSIYGLSGPDFDLYADTPMTMPISYAYDKAGMIGFTRYLACALGPHGVRVNCLAPGGLLDGSQPASFIERYCARTPLGRMASGDDVLGALLLLASDAGAYITGVTLAVDGGFTAR